MKIQAKTLRRNPPFIFVVCRSRIPMSSIYVVIPIQSVHVLFQDFRIIKVKSAD